LAQDLLLGITADNLIRWVLREAAATRELPVRRMSHAHTVHCVRAYAPRLERAVSAAERQALWNEMLRVIAAVPLPVRMRLGQPRQVWKKARSYPPRPTVVVRSLSRTPKQRPVRKGP